MKNEYNIKWIKFWDKLQGKEVRVMKKTEVTGYKKKSKQELLKAIDDCITLSQLFALIQHENISMQMHSQPGASNLVPKVLSAREIVDKKDTPLERLKDEIKKSVEKAHK